MQGMKKLKPLVTVGRILWGIFVSLLIIGTLLIIRNFYGSDVVFLLGALYPTGVVVWSLVIFIRTRNGHYLILLLAMLCFAAANLIRVFYRESVAEYFLLGFFCLALGFGYAVIKKRLGHPYRKILERAAGPVEDNRDGYTPRPYPAGKFCYQSADLKKFSRFLLKHRIALPYFEENRVVLLLEYSFWHLSNLKRDYRDDTHVIFTRQGEIIVNVSRSSYNQFREELTFDKLCASLGDLFRHFLELFRGKRERDILKIIHGEGMRVPGVRQGSGD